MDTSSPHSYPSKQQVEKNLVDQIDDLLPQTQCTQCGYSGCRPYAQAIANGDASYNQCPPGGAEGVQRLATFLGMPIIALNPQNGIERPRMLASIDGEQCIGCTLCIQACPVDAIVGAAKQMHVILDDWCTGCNLCIAPCPVDCITSAPITAPLTGWQAWSTDQASLARQRYQRREQRLHGPDTTNTQVSTSPKLPEKSTTTVQQTNSTGNDKQALLAKILANAKKINQDGQP